MIATLGTIRWSRTLGLIPEGALTPGRSRTHDLAAEGSSTFGRSSITRFVGAARPHTPRLPPLPQRLTPTRNRHDKGDALRLRTNDKGHQLVKGIVKEIGQHDQEQYSSQPGGFIFDALLAHFLVSVSTGCSKHYECRPQRRVTTPTGSIFNARFHRAYGLENDASSLSDLAVLPSWMPLSGCPDLRVSNPETPFREWFWGEVRQTASPHFPQRGLGLRFLTARGRRGGSRDYRRNASAPLGPSTPTSRAIAARWTGPCIRKAAGGGWSSFR